MKAKRRNPTTQIKPVSVEDEKREFMKAYVLARAGVVGVVSNPVTFAIGASETFDEIKRLSLK
jgi:hypothetical protein